MSFTVKSLVLVGCRGGAGHTHRLIRLRQYERSESDGTWERIQGDDEWFLRKTEEGVEQYPRPEFRCPKCKRERVYEHDVFQRELERAASDDGLLLI
ncbi:hypothetical protein JOD62_001706 [Microbacterium keratanolyticum]|nr:hypothetical protein [Microbacterium keratanolyticum]MBM7469158.1 hypothetical protein [Microbacterium keratanolyticum]